MTSVPSIRTLFTTYVLPAVWTAAIAFPIMGFSRATAAALFMLAGIIVFTVITRRRGLRRPHGLLRARLESSRAVRHAWVFVLAAAIAAPLLLNSYSLDVFTSVLFYMMLALGLNLLVGDLGLLNLGYIAFYGIGAYTYAILAARFGISFWIALAAGGAAASVFSLIIAIPTLRLRGDYLAIATLGFGEIVRIVFNNWDSLTNGPNGIMNVPRPWLPWIGFLSGMSFTYLVLCFVILQVYVLVRIKQCRFGRYAVAIRENERASAMVGINTYAVKTVYFMLSAFFGGVAGVLFASKQMFVSPDSFTFIESVYVLAMVILGGMGNIAGVMLGAFTLVVLPELLRGFVVYRMLIFALLLITMMLFRPEGLLGKKA